MTVEGWSDIGDFWGVLYHTSSIFYNVDTILPLGYTSF